MQWAVLTAAPKTKNSTMKNGDRHLGTYLLVHEGACLSPCFTFGASAGEDEADTKGGIKDCRALASLVSVVVETFDVRSKVGDGRSRCFACAVLFTVWRGSVVGDADSLGVLSIRSIFTKIN